MNRVYACETRSLWPVSPCPVKTYNPIRKITGGDADRCENKGLAKKATQKLVKLKELKIDGLRDAVRVGDVRRDEAGTLSAGP